MSHPLAIVFSERARRILPQTDGEPSFVLRGAPVAGLGEAVLAFEQTFRSQFLALQWAGCRVETRITGEWGFGYCCLTRHRQENLANIARALVSLRPGGMLIVAGTKECGAGPIEKLLDESIGLAGKTSLSHVRMCWQRRPDMLPDAVRQWQVDGDMQTMGDGGFWSHPAAFSWDRVDEGSKRLVSFFPSTLAGCVADLGCGWGYLGDAVLRRCPEVRELHAFEAELHALNAARLNLGDFEKTHTIAYHWWDVGEGVPAARFDAVIVNPPFHRQGNADPSLGQAFVAAAAHGLRPQGRLYMVANRHLPYEQTLSQLFSRWTCLDESAGYKVFHAIR